MKVRIYGYGIEGKRENWKGHYRVVRRYPKEAKNIKGQKVGGRIKSWRKWSQKNPTKTLNLKDKGIILSGTGKEIAKKIADLKEAWLWLGLGMEIDS